MTRSLRKQNPAGGPGSACAFAGSELRIDHSRYSASVKALELATGRRDSGIALSSQHAEEHAPGWINRAVRMLERFGREEVTPWTCEHFRAWAEVEGLDSPPEKRAFGAVIQAGLREGWFERVGYAPAASSNGAPKPLYLQSGGRSE